MISILTYGCEAWLLTDQLMDGALWSFNAYDAPSGELLQLEELWQTHADQASPL